MATIGNSGLSLFEAAKRMGADGKVLDIAEIMTQENQILKDMRFQKCNSGLVNKYAVRSSLPEATWRALYQGVENSKSSTEEFQDTCALLEARSEIDAALVQTAGNKNELLMTESIPHVEAMNNAMANSLFYGDVKKNPKTFTGLSPKYASLSTDVKKPGFNVIDGGGAGANNTSMWLVTWGANSVYGIYPDSTEYKGGLQVKDLGEESVVDSSGRKYRAYACVYSWYVGLTVKDYRACVRIANIDTASFANAGESGYAGANLIKLLIQGYHKLKLKNMGQNAIYCNSTVFQALDLLANSSNNLALQSAKDVAGVPIIEFRGIPIRCCDAISDSESKVS